MRKLFILATAIMISSAANAGLTDLYNAVNTNEKANTKVEAKAAEVKNKIDSKLNILNKKAASTEESTTAKQEEIKAQLEEKLAALVQKGEGNSETAEKIKAEIQALQKLIDAARK